MRELAPGPRFWPRVACSYEGEPRLEALRELGLIGIHYTLVALGATAHIAGPDGVGGMK